MFGNKNKPATPKPLWTVQVLTPDYLVTGSFDSASDPFMFSSFFEGDTRMFAVREAEIESPRFGSQFPGLKVACAVVSPRLLQGIALGE